MSIVDKLGYLEATKSEIKAAIEAKGVIVNDDVTFRGYAGKILDISGLEINRSTEWQPHPDWYDIKTIVETGVLEWSGEKVANARYGFVVSDSNLTITIPSGTNYTYYLSDGKTIVGSSSTQTITWDRTKDKDCELGYKTRAVIVCTSDRDISIKHRSFKNDGVDSIYIYFGDCNITTMEFSGNGTSYENRLIQAIVSSERTTSNESSIGGYAFYNCSSLVSVNIPDGVTSIGGYVFHSCYSLVSVNIPDSVTSIGDNGFFDCRSLVSVNIPDSVTSIGINAFQSCSSLAMVNIPDSVVSISNGVFQGCSSLAIVNIPDSVVSIGTTAFQSCSSLAMVNIPDSVVSIGGSAFNGCRKLAMVNIPDSVTSFGADVFYGCLSLAYVTIPDNASIGTNFFYNCSSLVSVISNSFNSSLTISASINLSVSSLERIIENYTDRTGIATPIAKLTIGASNLSKLSQEYKQLAKDKNITLA